LPPPYEPKRSCPVNVISPVDEFDGGEEPDALAVMLDGLDADRRGEVRFACARRDSDMAPGFWPWKRRSTTAFIHWRGRPWPQTAAASSTAARFMLRSGFLTAH